MALGCKVGLGKKSGSASQTSQRGRGDCGHGSPASHLVGPSGSFSLRRAWKGILPGTRGTLDRGRGAPGDALVAGLRSPRGCRVAVFWWWANEIWASRGSRNAGNGSMAPLQPWLLSPFPNHLSTKLLVGLRLQLTTSLSSLYLASLSTSSIQS